MTGSLLKLIVILMVLLFVGITFIGGIMFYFI